MLTVAGSVVAYLFSYGVSELKELVIVGAIWLIFFTIAARESGIIKISGKIVDALSWVIALNPISIALGRVSYSTYLAHIPVFAIVVGLGLKLSPNLDRNLVAMLVILAMILTVPISFLFYNFIERPGVRLGHRWMSKEK